METLPVTLIVKAPNQQIEDQTIKCELSWTINKLKQHLSEVYPSKPPKNEQKLIYSGQLLSDSLILKDVLRQYEGQETHTVHLVCAPKMEPIPAKKSNNSAPPQVSRSTETPDSRVPPTAPSDANLNLQWNFDANQIHPDYAAQWNLMQQAYVQYMNQYMQLAASSYGTQNLYQQNQAVPQQPPVIEPQQQNENPQGAQNPPVRDPENIERDWLDNFYAISRLLVLFSVVYFYSSLLRFTLVLVLGLSIYLYQIGFFRNINNNNLNHNNNTADNQPQEEQAPSRLTVVWTFFTTFFASLLPEIPNAV